MSKDFKKFAKDITDADKQEYLGYLKDGYDPGSAARMCGTTGTQFRRLRREHSQWYDPEFADACAVAETSPARDATRRERAEEMFWIAVENGEKWAVEKALYAYHPDFEHLRHHNLRVSGGIDVAMKMILPHLSDDELRQRLAEIEAREHELIEHKPIHSLPPAA